MMIHLRIEPAPQSLASSAAMTLPRSLLAKLPPERWKELKRLFNGAARPPYKPALPPGSARQKTDAPQMPTKATPPEATPPDATPDAST